MSGQEFSDVSVAAAPAENWGEALRLVFSGRGPDIGQTQQQDALAKLRADAEGNLAGLFEARRAGKLLGAVWVQMQPGRTASMQPPQLSAELAEPFGTGPGFSAIADSISPSCAGAQIILIRRTFWGRSSVLRKTMSPAGPEPPTTTSWR